MGENLFLFYFFNHNLIPDPKLSGNSLNIEQIGEWMNKRLSEQRNGTWHRRHNMVSPARLWSEGIPPSFVLHFTLCFPRTLMVELSHNTFTNCRYQLELVFPNDLYCKPHENSAHISFSVLTWC